jgi:hypothetical protein
MNSQYERREGPREKIHGETNLLLGGDRTGSPESRGPRSDPEDTKPGGGEEFAESIPWSLDEEVEEGWKRAAKACAEEGDMKRAREALKREAELASGRAEGEVTGVIGLIG